MLSGGWLRKKAAPTARTHDDGVLRSIRAPNGEEWLAVTTIVSDPKYLTQDFVSAALQAGSRRSDSGREGVSDQS